MKYVLWASALVSAALSIPAHAAEVDSRFYFSPMYGVTGGDDHVRRAEEGYGPQIAIGRNTSERWGVELAIWDGSFDGEDGEADWDERGLRLDGLYYFSRNPGFSPYLVIGGGVMESEKGSFDSQDGMFNIGLGFQRRVHRDGFGLRLDARYRYGNLEENSVTPSGDTVAPRLEELQVLAGLVIPYGQRRDAVPVVVAPVVVALDADNDGVTDANDRCPGTAPGLAVDVFGCPSSAPRVLEGVNFALNSAELTDYSKAILDQVAGELKSIFAEKPATQVEIGGHTDNTGDPDANMRMSLRRAESVRNYLIAQGVTSGNLVARGYGQTRPVSDNSTGRGRLLNRRVELRIVGN